MRLTFTLFLTLAIVFILPETGVSQNKTEAADQQKIYEYVENMPSYNGGQDAMLKYLSTSIPYANAQVQGMVVVSFVVDTDGSVNQVKVLKGLDPKLDSVCVQSVKKMSGQWTPGSQNNKPVAVRYMLPVRFTNTGSGTAGNNLKETMPEYKAGALQLLRFLDKNLEYNRAISVEGTSQISFIVNEDGSLTDFNIVKTLLPELDREAIRVLKLTSGEWSPGSQQGVPVKVRYTVPVRFK
jgi:TonB family protein